MKMELYETGRRGGTFGLMSFKELNLAFMLFCSSSCLERPQVSPSSCLRIFLARIESVFP